MTEKSPSCQECGHELIIHQPNMYWSRTNKSRRNCSAKMCYCELEINYE